MLPPKLKEIKDKIEKKSRHLRTDKEDELLNELAVLEKHLDAKSESIELNESVKSSYSQITSGPSGSCPCCGN